MASKLRWWCARTQVHEWPAAAEGSLLQRRGGGGEEPPFVRAHEGMALHRGGGGVTASPPG
jgi:hypothetical protein